MQKKEDSRMLSDELRIIGNLMRREMDRAMREQEDALPRAQGMMLCYLYDHQAEPVYQRDIEGAFRIRRSTATEILQGMEKSGLICREPVPEDGRLKCIRLTEKAEERQTLFIALRRMLDERMCKGINQRELENFMKVAEKIRHNLEEGEHD